MQSIIDASTAVCEPGGIKRAASPLSLCLSSSAEDHHPLPQHEFSCPPGQVCYYKRLRTSNPHLSLKNQNTPAASARAPPLVVWRDFRNREFKMVEEPRKPNYEALDPSDRMSNMIAKTATPFTSTQQSKLGIEPRGPGEYFKPHGRLHNFFTKASIETTRGIFDLERVQVDERSPFNLVPWSVATNLDLMLYSGKTLAITIADRLVQTNQYSQFTIRVAGHNTMINTGVISGLQTILLGREWIRRVRLLNDFGNQNYFIPVPLAVEVADEKLPNIFDTEVGAKDVKPVEMAKCDEIAEEHDDDEFRNDDSSNGRSSLDDGPLSESEPSFDGQNLFDGDTPSDELLSLGDGTLSDSGTSEVTPTDEDKDDDQDENEEDDESEDNDEDTDDDGNEDEDDECDDECEGCEDCDGYDECEESEERKGYDECHDECEGCEDCDDYDECEEREECKGYDECEGCEECEGYDECEGCEECEGYEKYEEFGEGHENQQGEEGTDDNLQDFMEQYTHIERFTDADVDAEQTKEAHRQQSESKGEPALPNSYYHIVNQEQSAMPDPTKSQVSGVQARVTKRQSKEIANILNHISRTPAGQSFKAPVEQLWPECAGAYATTVSNPIDLGTIQAKVKNNIYSSVNDFRADVVLLYQNSVDFNGIDHIITSTALEVRDTILNALDDMEEGKGSTMLRASTRATGV